MSATTITSSSLTGIATAVLVLLALGMVGSVGWLTALVLAALSGWLLGALVHWLTEAGTMAMDGDEWAPVGVPAVPPAPAEPPAESAPAQAEAPEDDLRRIRGIGDKVAAALRDAGVTRFAQIAAWDDARLDELAVRIGRPATLIRRDDWVGQARTLAGQGRA